MTCRTASALTEVFGWMWLLPRKEPFVRHQRRSIRDPHSVGRLARPIVS
jgi:hypothetical protein